MLFIKYPRYRENLSRGRYGAMPGREVVNGEPYRYAYQGQEKDTETNKEAFQLRLWDARIGRWLTFDPMRQYHSPYMGMDNRPNMSIDPTGGSTDCGKADQPPCPTPTINAPSIDLGVFT